MVSKIHAFAPIFLLVSCHAITDTYVSPVKDKSEITNGIDSLDEEIRHAVSAKIIDKASIAIICNNDLIYKKAYGTSDSALFQAASISKVLTSFAALTLVEEGELELDKPLCTYLDEPYFPKGSKGELITLRMILSHTSGLGNDITGKDRKIYHTPGKGFHYSGGGFTYLMKVIETITHQNFDDYMENNILLPLGMKKSAFSVTRPGGTKFVSAAASLRSNPEELSKFFIEFTNPKIFSPKLSAQMQTITTPISEHYSWGLGLGIQKGKYGEAIWHWGNNNNYHKSLAIIFPKERIGIIIMTQGKNGDLIYAKIAHDAIGGEYYGLERAVMEASNKEQ